MSTGNRLAAVGLCLFGSFAWADERAVGNFLLLPVTTELQRSLLGLSTAAYGVINVNGVIVQGNFDAATMDMQRFQKELAGLAKDRPGAIRMYFRYHNWQPQPGAEKLLEAAVAEQCRKAGFRAIATGKNFTGTTWQDQVASLEDSVSAPEDLVEPLVQDDRVRVYPVRTKLSRYLTGNADCVAHVRKPFDGRTRDLPIEARDSIERCVAQLDLQAKHVLNLHIASTKAGEGVIEQFLNRSGDGPSAADRFAHSIGFGTCTVTHSPCGGAPESLVSLQAPDFNLETLDGKKLNLRDSIRDRVALITFWGVACGPCREEAPHLSALFKKYSESGFTVIAVNAYDESPEIVADYVQKGSLQQPIVLMGKRVAEEKYSVAAYPTSFWVDHNGKIVDYAIGFDPGDETWIAKTIERLLAQRKSASQ